MADVKKRASSSKSKKASKKPADYRVSYVELRTMLDSLEYCALEYYVRGRSAAQRKAREAEIAELIKPALHSLLVKIRAPNDPHLSQCPDGLYTCCGGCVPYQCPESYSE